ncbi:MAG: carboxylating nicotinate-nucleotide diphosphorylase [Ignavibacteria bacterium]
MDLYKNFDFKKANELIDLALKEDLGKGDITSELLIPSAQNSKAELLVKENGIAAGLKIFQMVFNAIDKIDKKDKKNKITNIKFYINEGDRVSIGEKIALISGNTRNILLGERTGLNILQRMCGIASFTNELKKTLNNKSIKIIDTRKTTPNFRLFEKLAVKIGGGDNHRFGLYDMVLIKDNHIEANGGIANTLNKLSQKKKHPGMKVEIEVKDLKELEEVLMNGRKIIDRVMLDNFEISDVRKAISLNRKIFELELSGGIDENNIKHYSKLKGVDFISIGSLTHSAGSMDISLNFVT